MNDLSNPMVLRSINLPAELDDRLRLVAFSVNHSASDLMCLFVAEEANSLLRELSSASEERMQQLSDDLQRRIKRVFADGERNNFGNDAAKIKQFIDRQEKRRAEWARAATRE